MIGWRIPANNNIHTVKLFIITYVRYERSPAIERETSHIPTISVYQRLLLHTTKFIYPPSFRVKEKSGQIQLISQIRETDPVISTPVHLLLLLRDGQFFFLRTKAKGAKVFRFQPATFKGHHSLNNNR